MLSDGLVTRADKSVYWDNNATSQSTTKAGETYLGKEVAYTSERGTTVNLHSDKSWDEELVQIQVGKPEPEIATINNEKVESVAVSESSGMSLDTQKITDVADGVGMGMTAKGAIMSLADANELSPMAGKMLKVSEHLGAAAGVVSAVSSAVEAYNNPTTGNIIKAGVNTALVFARINPFVNLAIGIMDVTGVSDKIYDSVGNTMDATLKF